MAISERAIEAVAAITPDSDMEMQTKRVLDDVLDVMRENPEQLNTNIDVAIDHYKEVLKASPAVIPIITPVRAAAVYLDEFVRAPLTDASSTYKQPTSGVFNSITRGIYYLSSALTEAEGALSHGVSMQVMTELRNEARNLSPEERDEYVARHKPFRTFLTERRMGIFLQDKTGGILLWKELSDMIDLSQKSLPYFGDVPMDPNTIDPITVMGGEFVIDAYRMLYPAAKQKLGEGIVVSQ